jgi:ribosomal protein S18 acetylase RimI-like enzyme
MNELTLRLGVKADHAVIVEYNHAMALETEHKRLDFDVLSAGVAAVFDDPSKGFYLVAERAGEVVGQLMVTTEWSDWRNGWFWWIQSVYVHPRARRQGVFRALFREVERVAKTRMNVIGLRLYVEKENVAAQGTYRSLGMDDAGYLVFEMTPLG